MTELSHDMTGHKLASTPDDIYQLRFDGFSIIDGIKKGEPFGKAKTAPSGEGWQASKVLLTYGDIWNTQTVTLEYDQAHTLFVRYVVNEVTAGGSETTNRKLIVGAVSATEHPRKFSYEKSLHGNQLSFTLLPPPQTIEYWRQNLHAIADDRGKEPVSKQRFFSRRRTR